MRSVSDLIAPTLLGLVILLLGYKAAPMRSEAEKVVEDARFGDWPEPNREIWAPIGFKTADARKEASFKRGLVKSILIKDEQPVIEKKKKSWLSRLKGFSSSSSPDFLQHPLDTSSSGGRSELAVTQSEANALAKRFNVSEDDFNTPELLQWNQIKNTVSMAQVIQRAVPFIFHDYHDEYFAKLIMTSHGNYKTYLALLSDDDKDRKAAVQYLILEYEAEEARRNAFGHAV